MSRRSPFALATFALALAACDSYSNDPGTPPPAPIPQQVLSGAGDITQVVTDYRTLIGAVRRISWDGVPDTLNNADNKLPGEFFKLSQGAVFTTAGTGFRNDSTLFADVNPKYADQFAFFSATKTFAAVGSSVMDVTFRVRADTSIKGAVTGFGAVFSDVDAAGSTLLEYFDRNNVLIGRHAAPVRTDAAGLSFLGVKFESALVARVRITLGTGALGPGIDDVTDNGTVDLVILDDFNYGEPEAQP